MKRRRATHYVPHNGRGLGCPALMAELTAYLAGVEEQTGPGGWRREVATVPYPKKSTDIRRVNCLGCWRAIGRMVADALAHERSA